MISRQQRAQMRRFVLDRIEESGRYDIRRQDDAGIQLRQKDELFTNPSTIYVVLHDRKMTLNQYRAISSSNREQKIRTANIFYKDGETFMVWLGRRGHWKGDERSLKNYTKEQRDRMIHLRGLEKEVLNNQDIKALAYFQPETTHLPMSLRGFYMGTVELDYSHLQDDFAKDGPSIDFKLTEERFNVAYGGMKFVDARGYRGFVIPAPVGSDPF